MINEELNIQENFLNEIHDQMKKCQEATQKNFFVIGLGGKDSWATTLAAIDVFGKNNVLAVNVYSIFSNSLMPSKIAGLCQEFNIEYCDVDISAAIQEILSVPIGLFRIEKEKLHYMMSDLQKAEMLSMIRNTVLKGIADRHDAALLSGISLSKILTGWVSPNTSMFDWNPLVNCTHYQVQLGITGYNIGTEILNNPSGLDLNTKGGPFPEDYGLDFNSNDFLKNASVNEKVLKIKNLGLGIYQT